MLSSDQDWDWGLGLVLGLGPGIGDKVWVMGNGEWKNGKLEIESTPVPGNDSIISQATTTTYPPLTFDHEGVFRQQSAFSKYFSE